MILEHSKRQISTHFQCPLKLVISIPETVAVLPPPPIERGSGPFKSHFCPPSSTNQRHLKLGQCLEIDDRRSLSKFGDVT